MYSYDPDVLRTFSMIVGHMPPGCEDGNLFLTCKHTSRDAYWYKKGVNARESTMQPWMKKMAQSVSVTKDITNKSGRVTSITRMAIAQVPPEVMAMTTGHRNLKTLNRYNRSVYLKHFVAQALLRHPYDEDTCDLLDFDWHYTQQLALWNGKEIPAMKAYLADMNRVPLPCLSLIAPEVPSDFYWPPVISSAGMKDLVANTAKMKCFGPLGVVTSNLQGANPSASTSKYVMVDVAGVEDFIHEAVPTLCAVQSNRHAIQPSYSGV